VIVHLTTGYKVKLNEPDGIHHLFNAVFGEVATRLNATGALDDLRGAHIFGRIYDACICELHYVAGQLKHAQHEIPLATLLDEFAAHWDMLAEEFNRDPKSR